MTQFERLTKEEIIALDQKLDLCARLAMNTYLGLPVNMQGYASKLSNDEYALLSSYREPFVDLYKRRFPETCKDTIRNEIWPVICTEFSDTIAQLKINRRGRPEFYIVFPIMFYTFVCNNILNQSTVSKRNTRTKKKMEEQANTIQTELDKTKAAAKINSKYHARALCAHTRKSVRPRSERLLTYQKSSQEVFKALLGTASYDTIEDGENIEADAPVTNSPIQLTADLVNNAFSIYRYQTSAELGLFLREILELSETPNKSLDTIIRMMIVNQMDSLIIRTAVLHDLNGHVFLDISSPNSLLKWYYEVSHPTKTDEYINACITRLEVFKKELEDVASQKTDEQSLKGNEHTCKDHPPQNEGIQFSNVYLELASAFPITTYELNKILDFYLNRASLSDALSLWDISTNFLTALTQCIKGIIPEAQIITSRNRDMLNKVIRGSIFEDVINYVYYCFNTPKEKE